MSTADMINPAAASYGLLVNYDWCTGCHSCEIACRNELGLPVRYIGLGEKLDDMQPFDARAFVDALFG